MEQPKRDAIQSPPDMRIGVFLPEGYPLLPLSLVIESLRIANGFDERTRFSSVLISEDGTPVRSSCEFPAPIQYSLQDHPPFDILLVCAGVHSMQFRSKPVFSWLRRHYRAGVPIGGISSGAFLLARAGLLDGRSCAVHWEIFDVMREMFPKVDVIPNIYCTDGRIITCAGGIAVLDMMLHLMAKARGRLFARRLADLMIYPVVRGGHEPARINLRARTGVANPLVLKGIDLMEKNLERPIRVSEISRQLGTTSRHLERLFERSLKTTPSQYYMRLRMQEAKSLLQRTDFPIGEVALRCGFTNPSHFTRRFREAYGQAPSDHRRR